MKIQQRLIDWKAEHVICECGTEMQFVFRVRKTQGENIGKEVFLHTCPQCGRAEELEDKYPRAVWEGVE